MCLISAPCKLYMWGLQNNRSKIWKMRFFDLYARFDWLFLHSRPLIGATRTRSSNQKTRKPIKNAHFSFLFFLIFLKRWGKWLVLGLFSWLLLFACLRVIERMLVRTFLVFIEYIYLSGVAFFSFDFCFVFC